jgi:hypothetical protein
MALRKFREGLEVGIEPFPSFLEIFSLASSGEVAAIYGDNPDKRRYRRLCTTSTRDK